MTREYRLAAASLPVVGIVFGVAVAGAAWQHLPQPLTGDEDDSLAAATKRAERSNVRQSGAKLAIRKPTVAGEGDKRRFSVEWEFDYDGPRPPFTVLKPSFGQATAAGTKLSF
ncbi:MAG: hypothetical protein K2X87_06250 [Gemmataceae bacterium]|nr:hypothetical protein [Gemmataceae bacterium]